MSEPQFFSATIDHEVARIKGYWLRNGPGEGKPYEFHIETVGRYFLVDEEGLRATMRSIRNILDYSLDRRLESICEALDGY